MDTTTDDSGPTDELTVLRELVAKIRAMKAWHYEDGQYLDADSIRNLIDDFENRDSERWVVLESDGNFCLTLADPSRAEAQRIAEGLSAETESRQKFVAATRADAKIRMAEAVIRMEAEQAEWEAASALRAAEKAAVPPLGPRVTTISDYLDI